MISLLTYCVVASGSGAGFELAKGYVDLYQGAKLYRRLELPIPDRSYRLCTALNTLCYAVPRAGGFDKKALIGCEFWRWRDGNPPKLLTDFGSRTDYFPFANVPLFEDYLVAVMELEFMRGHLATALWLRTNYRYALMPDIPNVGHIAPQKRSSSSDRVGYLALQHLRNLFIESSTDRVRLQSKLKNVWNELPSMKNALSGEMLAGFGGSQIADSEAAYADDRNVEDLLETRGRPFDGLLFKRQKKWDPLVNLCLRGVKAFPSIVNHLQDRRYTRTAFWTRGPGNEIVTVGYYCRAIVESFSGTDFPNAAAGRKWFLINANRDDVGWAVKRLNKANGASYPLLVLIQDKRPKALEPALYSQLALGDSRGVQRLVEAIYGSRLRVNEKRRIFDHGLSLVKGRAAYELFLDIQFFDEKLAADLRGKVR